MGQVCCKPKNEEKKTIDVPQIDNSGNYEDITNNNNTPQNAMVENNAIIICSNKPTNELNYNIKYRPKPKKYNNVNNIISS